MSEGIAPHMGPMRHLREKTPIGTDHPNGNTMYHITTDELTLQYSPSTDVEKSSTPSGRKRTSSGAYSASLLLRGMSTDGNDLF